MTTRSFTELEKLATLEERYEYLMLGGSVGYTTFGHERYVNQQFYTSRLWKMTRERVIVRDQGCDLAVPGFEIHSRIIIHHMNPMTARDIVHNEESIVDPEFLISTTHRTHNAIHYGDASLLPQPIVERRPGDTKLW